MSRSILSSLAVAVVGLAWLVSSTTLLAQDGVTARTAKSGTTTTTQLKSNQRPVRCDCTNCSAEHCPKPKPNMRCANNLKQIGLALHNKNLPANLAAQQGGGRASADGCAN